MKSKDILEKVMKDEKVTQKELAQALGLGSQQAVGNLLKREGSVRLDRFVEMMNIMGYEIIVRKKKTIGEVEEMAIE